SVWRLAALNTAAWETPLGPIGRAHEQKSSTDVDRDHCSFMSRPPQPPPDAGERETKAERQLPGGVEMPGEYRLL
ncbi:MAG: hypothetical protein WB647_15390, partial [Roseiarcus sp.]